MVVSKTNFIFSSLKMAHLFPGKFFYHSKMEITSSFLRVYNSLFHRQVTQFMEQEVTPILKAYESQLAETAMVSV